MSAATDAIGAHHFSIPGANCQYCSGRGTPLPYNGWCSRYIAANDKAAGDPPRPLRLPLSSPHQTECTASSGSRCNQNHGYKTLGNLLLWIRLARTGQMISGLLLFCSHRNFHFFFTSHTTFNLHFAPWYPPKCATDREKTLVLRTKVVFW